ncbi:MAG TPA: hypothetical protein VHX87_03750 [Galbitalea sp.]|nr:hypothetical protein [Galbitalea sp.]
MLRSHFEDRNREGGVAMLTAILFIIIMAGVSTIILGVVSAQTIPSYLDQKGTKTVYSAQAGIQAALSIIRSGSTLDTTSGNYYGDPTKMPCTVTGTSNGLSDGNSYSVSIAYFTLDPTGQSASWITTNQLACKTGTLAQYGTSAYGLSTTPKYALITSAGTATQIPVVTTQANRSITALYTFQVSTANILGGLIYNNGQTACLQAVKAASGQAIAFVAASSCSSTGTNAALQLWSYTTNWQIALTSTEVGGVVTTASLCITGPTVSGGATQNALLKSCQKSTASARWNQLWSWTGSYTWEGELSDISGPNGNAWLSPPYADGTSPIGKDLEVVNATSPIGTMAPSAQVGAGAASYDKDQIVNYAEFGRCTDVTNQPQPDTDAYPMIDYPCKQDPTGGTTNITWNQLWYYCEVGDAGCDTTVDPTNQQIYVLYNNSASSKYCLTTPSTTASNPRPTTPATTAANQFPYFAACATSGALVAQQNWDRVYVGDDYLDSYLFVDTYGRCLEANSSDIFSGDISYITVNSCTGASYQKWNAPPTYTDSTVGGYREISGG